MRKHNTVVLNVSQLYIKRQTEKRGKTPQPAEPCTLELEVTRAKCICRRQEWKKKSWQYRLLLLENPTSLSPLSPHIDVRLGLRTGGAGLPRREPY